MIDRDHAFAIKGQARMLGLSRSPVYYKTQLVSAEALKLMRRLDELQLDYPFAGGGCCAICCDARAPPSAAGMSER